MDFDRAWWTIREKFDDYLEAADNRAETFGDALSMLDNYIVKCTADFADLTKVQHAVTRADDEAHRQLHETWHSVEHEVGLLVARIADSRAFHQLAHLDVMSADAEVAKEVRNEEKLALVKPEENYEGQPGNLSLIQSTKPAQTWADWIFSFFAKDQALEAEIKRLHEQISTEKHEISMIQDHASKTNNSLVCGAGRAAKSAAVSAVIKALSSGLAFQTWQQLEGVFELLDVLGDQFLSSGLRLPSDRTVKQAQARAQKAFQEVLIERDEAASELVSRVCNTRP